CVDRLLAGHVIFTTCGVEGSGAKAALLGPLAVVPSRQRHGIGSALVRAGLESARESGVDLVCVLGDPRFYGRFGFVAETAIEPSYPLPPEWAGAWQSQRLSDSKAAAGKLIVPPQWREPALWGP
ncbi:MAG: N-acetyltransferase, partial [Gammaproteobacteria bacterium]